MREVILDTETTGLKVEEGHRIVEIGCIALADGVEEARFHRYVNPGRSMDKDAQAVHGLTDGFLRDAPSFKEVALALLEFIGEDKIVMHNAPFDMGFLNAEFERIGMPPLLEERAVDTLLMARRKWPGQSNSLDALCKRLNVDASKRDRHGALIDAHLLAQVYQQLMGRKPQGRLNLMRTSHADAPPPLRKTEERLISRPPKPAAKSAKRLSRPPTEEELAEHRHLLASLGASPLWKRFAEKNG